MTQPKIKALLANPKFIAIVGMLGSDGPGERANAAALAGRMLKEAGGTWADVLAGAGPPARRENHTRVAALENQIDNLQRQVEILRSDVRQRIQQITDLRRERQWALDENRKLIEQQAETVHQLRALKKTIEELQKVRQETAAQQEKKPGWGFQDIPPWSEEDARQPRERTWSGHSKPRDYSKGETPVQEDARVFPILYRQYKNWLDMIVANFWDDLSEWEIGFFQDFVDNKKPIKSDKQLAIFRRAGEKVGYSVDF